MDYQVLVIGAGPGGYHAAIRAAQLGQKTACAEDTYVGGVCLNVGCIPTKALLHVAEDLREAQHAKDYGVDFGTPKVDLKQVDKWKNGVVTKLTGGVRSLLKSNKVDLLEGRAVLIGNASALEEAGITPDPELVARAGALSAEAATPVHLAVDGVHVAVMGMADPVRDTSAQAVAALIRQIRAERVSAVFVEGIGNPATLRRLADEAGVRVRGRLYADALSEPDGPAGTYEALVRHNTTLMVRAMRGDAD